MVGVSPDDLPAKDPKESTQGKQEQDIVPWPSVDTLGPSVYWNPSLEASPVDKGQQLAKFFHEQIDDYEKHATRFFDEAPSRENPFRPLGPVHDREIFAPSMRFKRSATRELPYYPGWRSSNRYLERSTRHRPKEPSNLVSRSRGEYGRLRSSHSDHRADPLGRLSTLSSQSRSRHPRTTINGRKPKWPCTSPENETSPAGKCGHGFSPVPHFSPISHEEPAFNERAAIVARAVAKLVEAQADADLTTLYAKPNDAIDKYIQSVRARLSTNIDNRVKRIFEDYVMSISRLSHPETRMKTDRIVAGSIQGMSVEALADTGAGRNFISKTLIKKLNVKFDRSIQRSVTRGDGSKFPTFGVITLPWQFNTDIDIVSSIGKDTSGGYKQVDKYDVQFEVVHPSHCQYPVTLGAQICEPRVP